MELNMKINFLRGPAVSISASADDWELYNADEPEREQDRDFVADELNRGIENIVSRAPTRREVDYRSISSLLHLYSAWGSSDTVVRHKVEDVLDKVYGEA